MNQQQILRYFLGGNTYRGFYSLYDSFVPLADGYFLWVIKGGPGCGKSSFMRMIGTAAEKAGLDVEYAVCSGDPSSLDGVYIPALKTAYTDGTAPHIADPNMAGVDSGYLNLGEFYDYPAISEYRPELKELYRNKAAAYQKAYSIIAAAGQLQQGWQSGFSTASEREAAVRRADGIALREFGKRRREKGRLTTRFLSAITHRGLSSFPETLNSLCTRFYVFENRLQLADSALKALMDAALDAGHDVVLCPNPLAPELAEAILVPTLGLGFISDSAVYSDIPTARQIRLDALASSERLRQTRPELRRCEKYVDALLNEAYLALSEVSRLHERIEGIFNPSVDFDGMTALAREHIRRLGLG